MSQILTFLYAFKISHMHNLEIMTMYFLKKLIFRLSFLNFFFNKHSSNKFFILKICHKESEYLLLESTELYDNLFTMYSYCREKQGR